MIIPSEPIPIPPGFRILSPGSSLLGLRGAYYSNGHPLHLVDKYTCRPRRDVGPGESTRPLLAIQRLVAPHPSVFAHLSNCS
jgi:hypothetical protein